MKQLTAALSPRKLLATRRLTVAGLATLIHVMAVAVVVELGLRFLSLPVLARVLGVALKAAPARLAARRAGFDLTDRQRHTVHLARRLMRHWPWGAGTCLRQSLVIAHLLRALEPTLRLGVRREDGIVEAHAWVEVPGMINTGGQGFQALEWT